MTRYKKPNVEKMQLTCDMFNNFCPVGGRVSVMLDGKDGPVITTTTSKAQILSGHSEVVWLAGVSGCYLLDRVTILGAPS